MKFPIDRIPSCLIFEFWNSGRIMAVGHWGSQVFHHHHEISDPKSIIMPYIENLGLWPDWGVGHRRRWRWVMSPMQKTFLVLRSFSHDQFRLQELKLCSEKRIFSGEGPGKVPNPGLLGHGSKIPDHTIETHTPTDLFSKFQLSRCYTGREIGHRRTYGQI
jgi:hypothetical protein